MHKSTDLKVTFLCFIIYRIMVGCSKSRETSSKLSVNKPTAQIKTVDLSGIIVGKQSQRSMPKATVLLCRIADPSAAEAECQINKQLIVTSDSQGHFFIQHAPFGQYLVLYALPDEKKGNPNEWDQIRVHYTWPLGVLDKRNGELSYIDIFGGNEGIFSRVSANMETKKGLYKNKSDVYVYLVDGHISSKQFGLSLEYSEGKPSIVSANTEQMPELKIEVTGK